MAAFRPIHEPVSYGKNLPPWSQDAKKGSKKKFSYRERANKIPLRDKLKQEEAEAQFEKSQREAQLRANKLLADRKRREEELKMNKKKPNGILKSGYGVDKSGFVTLTQDQLSTILNTLSKVQGSDNEVNLDVDSKDQLKLTIEKPDSRESELSAASATDQLESILSLSKKVKMAEESKRLTKNTSKNQTVFSDSKQETAKKQRHSKQVVMNFNLSGESATGDIEAAAKDKKTNKKPSNKKKVKIADENYDEDKVFIRSAAKVVVVEDESTHKSDDDKLEQERQQVEPALTKSEVADLPELSPRQKQLMIPRAHMTKGEKLRLQRELESASIEKLKKENAEHVTKLKLHADSGNSEQHQQNSTSSMKDVSKIISATKVFVEPDFVPGLGNVSDKTTSSHSLPNSSSKEITAVVPPPQSLTRAELKRLQWNKEKAEAPKEYDPWGRPGVGVGPGVIKQIDDSQPMKGQQSHRKQELTSQQQTDLHMQQTTSHSTKQSVANSSNVLRGPFQEPTTGVPTSILGLENPPREVLKSLAPQLKESLSKAQLLRLKWAEEKAVSHEDYNPFGRPGAGAPIRTDSGTVLTSYHSRQKQMMRKSIEDHYASQGAANEGSTSKAVEVAYNQSTQPNVVPSLDLTNPSLPQEEAEASSTARNHIRGQLVNLDPTTLKEREELRRKELKYQEEIRHQVEEKHRLKREERMQKLKEEAEEEAKFRAERNNAQREVQQAKEMNKLKEAKEVSRVDLVAEAMQKAKQEAEILKAKRRLEKLQAAGHDITHLRAAYEEKFSPRVGPVISDLLSPRGTARSTSTVPADVLSPRTQNSQAPQQHAVEPTAVPGLDLTSRTNTRHTSRADDSGGYVSNRVVTPHKWHGTQKENLSPVKEFGVQTDTPPPSRAYKTNQADKVSGGVKSKQVRVISGPKTRKGKESQAAKPWGWKNQVGKKFTAQSKRDPHYQEKQEEKVVRAQARKDQLLKQVQANSRHYPAGKVSRAADSMNTNRDTMNNHLSPRPKFTDSKSPRANAPESLVTSSRTDKPLAAGSRNTDKQKGNASSKQPATHSSGYELTADNLQFSADDEFVPFRRSDAVLSPSNAQEVSPISREQTQAALAREAYYKSMQPAQYGVQMHNIKDPHKAARAHDKDPLYNPSLLTKQPTDRQQQLLDSLRQMRQGLMAKQREIASVMSPDLPDNDYS